MYMERANDAPSSVFNLIYSQRAIDQLFIAAAIGSVEAVMEVLCQDKVLDAWDCNGTAADEALWEAFTEGCVSYLNQLRMDSEKQGKRKGKKGGAA